MPLVCQRGHDAHPAICLRTDNDRATAARPARCKTGSVTLLEPARAVDGSSIARRASSEPPPGERLDVDDAEALLSAEGADFERMLAARGRRRGTPGSRHPVVRA